MFARQYIVTYPLRQHVPGMAPCLPRKDCGFDMPRRDYRISETYGIRPKQVVLLPDTRWALALYSVDSLSLGLRCLGLKIYTNTIETTNLDSK